jgi:hypothetical protein
MSNTFTVSADVTYVGAPTDVGTIQFTNTGNSDVTARFAAGRFDNVQILTTVLIDGSDARNTQRQRRHRHPHGVIAG